jgi:hypothetical protein
MQRRCISDCYPEDEYSPSESDSHHEMQICCHGATAVSVRASAALFFNVIDVDNQSVAAAIEQHCNDFDGVRINVGNGASLVRGDVLYAVTDAVFFGFCHVTVPLQTAVYIRYA